MTTLKTERIMVMLIKVFVFAALLSLQAVAQEPKAILTHGIDGFRFGDRITHHPELKAGKYVKKMVFFSTGRLVIGFYDQRLTVIAVRKDCPMNITVYQLWEQLGPEYTGALNLLIY